MPMIPQHTGGGQSSDQAGPAQITPRAVVVSQVLGNTLADVPRKRASSRAGRRSREKIDGISCATWLICHGGLARADLVRCNSPSPSIDSTHCTQHQQRDDYRGSAWKTRAMKGQDHADSTRSKQGKAGFAKDQLAGACWGHEELLERAISFSRRWRCDSMMAISMAMTTH